MGSEKTDKVSVLVYKHRHGEDVSVYATHELALGAAVEIVRDNLNEVSKDAREAIRQMIADAAPADDVIAAWHDATAATSDYEHVEISDDVAVEGVDTPVPSPSGDVFGDVMAAMQNAEEAGGPEGTDYIELMRKIADEATRRAAVYSERLTPTLEPKCPKCSTTALDDMEVRETYSAYHPVKEVVDGKLFVSNALTVTCPSEQFDEGKGDYEVCCKSCTHTGTPESFGLGDSSEWEWL